ncbi:SAM-dependent methyltransferase [Arenibacterium sp. CAU 1754]
MPDKDDIALHYDQGALLERILQGLVQMGVTPPIDPDVLSPVDEFHIGGRIATEHLFEHLDLTAGQHVLDIGCGIGGPARLAAHLTGAHVTGIDLAAEFVKTGNALSELTGQADAVTLVQGNALDLPFEHAVFDAAYLIHVGMNIADKAGLFSQIARVLKPGGRLGIYDVMQVSDDPLEFPVPWASHPDHSVVASPAEYRAALAQAGFDVTAETDRRAFALDFFDKMSRQQARMSALPALGLHIVMGKSTSTKVSNMMANVRAGRVAPVEIIAQLRRE